jgi:hypothetical protein
VLAQITAEYEAGMRTSEIMKPYAIGKGTVHSFESCNQSLTPHQCKEAITGASRGLSVGQGQPPLWTRTHRNSEFARANRGAAPR